MRYRIIAACALVSFGFVSLALFVEPAVSLERLDTPGSRGGAVFSPLSLQFPSTFELAFGAAGDSQSRFEVPGSRHILRGEHVLRGEHILRSERGFQSELGRGAPWQYVQRQLSSWLDQGMTHTPALVMGLVLLLLVPPLAIGGWFFRWLQPSGNATRRLVVAAGSDARGFAGEETPSGRMAFARDAMLERIGPASSGSSQARFALNKSDLVVRIGREEDNEIQIRDKTVHRYHAVIDRSLDGGVSINDMSAEEGNGVTVNGQRVMRAQLKDGDRIGLGAVSLTFRLKPQ